MYIEKLSLANPNIKFTLTNNEKVIVSTSGSGNLLKTIHEVYGYLVSSNMINITASNEDYDIYGFICKPSILKSNRNHITTIVNGRIVKNIELNKAINDGYYTYKPDIKYPIVVLTINTDPTIIDVNIHPTKQDIKFSKIEELTKLVTDSIKDSLYKSLLVPKIEVKEIKKDNEIFMPQVKEYQVNKDLYKVNDSQVKFDFKEVEKEVIENKLDREEKNVLVKNLELYPVGSVMGTYIIAENEDNMYLIDQHAAQERINYERYLKSLSSKEITTTDLLIPITIELTGSDYLKLKERINILTDMGVNIEEFGLNTIIIKSHPTWLLEGYEKDSIERLIDLTVNEYNIDRVKFNDNIAKTLACKMSVKGNTRLTIDEMESLLNDLVLCDNPYNCPHGRPTIITFTKYELEKMFKRIMN